MTQEFEPKTPTRPEPFNNALGQLSATVVREKWGKFVAQSGDMILFTIRQYGIKMELECDQIYFVHSGIGLNGFKIVPAEGAVPDILMNRVGAGTHTITYQDTDYATSEHAKGYQIVEAKSGKQLGVISEAWRDTDTKQKILFHLQIDSDLPLILAACLVLTTYGDATASPHESETSIFRQK